MTDEFKYKLLKAIEQKPKTNQRQLAASISVSLGQLNYLINELLEGGYIITEETTTNKRKACLYYLTPAGFAERASVTMRYLNELKRTREQINNEIKILEEETSKIYAALQVGITQLHK